MNRFSRDFLPNFQKRAFYRLVYVMNRFQWIFIKSPYFSEITDSNGFLKESLLPFSALYMKIFNILAPIMIFLTKAFMNEQISVWILHICSFSGKSILNLKATRASQYYVFTQLFGIEYISIPALDSMHQIQWKYSEKSCK